jgi:hypothetical protein
VHDLYFNRQDLHTIEEKKVFIMLFYSELKEYVKNKLNIDLMTSACKDNKDRGNASTIVDMAKNLLKLDRIDDPQALRELFFSALAPFIIKNEEIIEERLELALNVIRHLATLPEPQKQKIQQANEASAFKILGQRIPKEEVSPSQMMGPENFLALLNHLRKIQEQRTVEDPSFEATVRENGWNREQLEQQIRYNLPRMDLRVNGQRITQYEQLRDIPDSLLAFLHLGAAHHTMKDPAHYLNGNALGMTVALPAPSEDRTAVQDLISLCHSEGKKAAWRQMPLELSPDFEAYLSEAVDQGLLPSSFRRAAVPQGQPIYPTRIDLILIDGAYDLQIEQDLVFGEYPMVAKAHLKTGNLAQVSWHFVTV